MTDMTHLNNVQDSDWGFIQPTDDSLCSNTVSNWGSGACFSLSSLPLQIAVWDVAEQVSPDADSELLDGIKENVGVEMSTSVVEASEPGLEASKLGLGATGSRLGTYHSELEPAILLSVKQSDKVTFNS